VARHAAAMISAARTGSPRGGAFSINPIEGTPAQTTGRDECRGHL
jgi:hypothetical protein